jgi:hypothetical protein
MRAGAGGGRSRGPSSAGGGALGQRSASGASLLGAPRAAGSSRLLAGGGGAGLPQLGEGGEAELLHGELSDEDGGCGSPVTPGPPSLGGGDLLGEPLMVRRVLGWWPLLV